MMSRWLRIVLTTWSFFMFFAGSPLLGLVLFPVMRLRAKSAADHRRRVTHMLHRGMWLFIRYCRWAGLIDIPGRVTLPAGIAPGQPYVLVANHPTLIDMFLLMGGLEVTCVAKGGWYKSLVLGPLLRSTDYLAGPGSGEEENEDVLGSMVAHLESGHALLVFPEGTRSRTDRLQRFRRGAVEAAIRAKVPIVPAFVSVDRPYLMKGVPFWHVPKDRARFDVEMFEPIDTTTLGPEDARRVNAELQAKYQARFARMLAERAEHPVLPSDTAERREAA